MFAAGTLEKRVRQVESGVPSMGRSSVTSPAGERGRSAIRQPSVWGSIGTSIPGVSGTLVRTVIVPTVLVLGGGVPTDDRSPRARIAPGVGGPGVRADGPAPGLCIAPGFGAVTVRAEGRSPRPRIAPGVGSGACDGCDACVFPSRVTATGVPGSLNAGGGFSSGWVSARGEASGSTCQWVVAWPRPASLLPVTTASKAGSTCCSVAAGPCATRAGPAAVGGCEWLLEAVREEISMETRWANQ